MKFHTPSFNTAFAYIAFLSTTALAAIAAPPSLDKASFDHLEENTIVFGAPPGTTPAKPLKTGLYELSYLGALRPSEGGSPYFLFSGKACQNCLEDRTIYAIRPIGGKPTTFVYPGKILEPRSRALLVESRAFFGKCLPRRGDSYVVFQKERIDRRAHLQSSVLVAEAGKDYFDENLIERHLPQLKTTLQLVKKKVCQEIEGRNRLMLSKPLDLHPHSDVNSDENGDDDEDSDKNKESSDDSTPAAKVN